MNANPSPDWTEKERLQVIAELSSIAIEKKLIFPHLAGRVAVTITMVATQASEVLENNRSAILAPSYLSSGYLDYLKTGVAHLIITTKVPLKLLDGSRQKLPRDPKVPLLPGRHKFDRINNPYPRAVDGDFLALPGTQIGWAESYWRLFEGQEHGIHQIRIEEDIEATHTPQ